MSVVDAIRNQAGGVVLARLSALAGEPEERTAAAIAAATPAILAALANSVLDGERLDALVDALRDFEGADPAETLATGPDAASDALETVLGPDLPTLVEVLSRFTGLDVPAMKTLVDRLGPIALGAVAARVTGGGGLTPANLTSFFTAEKPNVVRSLPSGLSLADIPANSDAPALAARTKADSEPFPWLFPALVAGLLALAAFIYMTTPPERPAPLPEPTAADPVPVPPPPP